MDQNFHLIEKYFKGELSGEELDLFHSKLQNDSAFEQEFRDMKLIREGAKASARMKALNVLQNVEANLTEKETTKINVSMRRLVSIAASLLVIATVSYFAISDRTGGTMTGDEVFATYYKPYTNLFGGVRSGEDNIELNTLAARAYNAYDIEDYGTSANLFSELLLKEKSAENFFYSGIANLESGNLELAKANFNTVMNNFSELRDQSQWYLAMTLFKDGSEDEAVVNIASLSKSVSDFTDKAKNLMSDMGLTLEDNTETGSIEEHEIHPVHGNDQSPDGSLQEMRRYQFGTISSIATNRKYKFFNEYPIDELEAGDMVEFGLIKGNRGKKPIAVIVQHYK